MKIMYLNIQFRSMEHLYQSAIKAFVIILCLWILINCEILAKASNFFLIRFQIFVTRVSKSSQMESNQIQINSWQFFSLCIFSVW